MQPEQATPQTVTGLQPVPFEVMQIVKMSPDRVVIQYQAPGGVFLIEGDPEYMRHFGRALIEESGKPMIEVAGPNVLDEIEAARVAAGGA